jgi:hypothetical protein
VLWISKGSDEDYDDEYLTGDEVGTYRGVRRQSLSEFVGLGVPLKTITYIVPLSASST